MIKFKYPPLQHSDLSPGTIILCIFDRDQEDDIEYSWEGLSGRIIAKPRGYDEDGNYYFVLDTWHDDEGYDPDGDHACRSLDELNGMTEETQFTLRENVSDKDMFTYKMTGKLPIK